MIMKFLHSNEKHILTTNLFVLNKGCQAIFRIHRITELWMDTDVTFEIVSWITTDLFHSISTLGTIHK